MSTALVAIGDLERMAQAFSKSQLFGTKTVDQCMALMLLASAENVHPAIAFRDFDIIQGRPAKKAEAMLRSFLAAGGSVEWHQLDDNGADATFSHPQGGKARISWDAARAKRAGLSGRDMYAKYARQMYRSRVVSEGCRTVYPAATSGMYEPGEVRAMARDDKRQEKDMGAAVIEDIDITLDIGKGSAAPQVTPPSSGSPVAPAEPTDQQERISVDQAMELAADLKACDPLAEAAFMRAGKLSRLDELLALDYSEAMDWIKRRKEKRGAK